MKSAITFLCIFCFVNNAYAELTNSSNKDVHLYEVVEAYAKTSGEKVVLDPRVKGRLRSLGLDLEQLSYSELSTILYAHNYATYRSEGVLVVIPSNFIKQIDVPVVVDGKTYAKYEYVADIIELDKACYGDLVPLIRPLMQPTSHMAGNEAAKIMYLVDTYANTIRIRSIIDKLESRLTSKQKCVTG